MPSNSLGIQASTAIEEEVIRILPNFGDAMDPPITALALFMTPPNQPRASHRPKRTEFTKLRPCLSAALDTTLPTYERTLEPRHNAS